MSIVLPYISYLHYFQVGKLIKCTWLYILYNVVAYISLKDTHIHMNIQASISHAYGVYCLNSLNGPQFEYMYTCT